MASKGHALAREALVRTLTAYSGITTEDGEADGTTLVDSNLIGRNDFITEKTILIMSGDAKDEDKGAASFNNVTGQITLQGTGFSAQIKAGTIYRVLNISTVEIDVANIAAKIDAIKGATGIFYEQTDTAVNITAIAASETDVLNLVVADTRYIVRSLRLKCADPGANTVTVRLYELVNAVLTELDSFAIDNANFGTYHSLMDMFGLPHLAGDNLKVTVQASAGGPYAVTGQYSHAKTNV
ncbi:hypothetical protein ES708_00281 [subsurface metagenome]